MYTLLNISLFVKMFLANTEGVSVSACVYFISLFNSLSFIRDSLSTEKLGQNHFSYCCIIYPYRQMCKCIGAWAMSENRMWLIMSRYLWIQLNIVNADPFEERIFTPSICKISRHCFRVLSCCHFSVNELCAKMFYMTVQCKDNHFS